MIKHRIKLYENVTLSAYRLSYACLRRITQCVGASRNKQMTAKKLDIENSIHASRCFVHTLDEQGIDAPRDYYKRPYYFIICAQIIKIKSLFGSFLEHLLRLRIGFVAWWPWTKLCMRWLMRELKIHSLVNSFHLKIANRRAWNCFDDNFLNALNVQPCTHRACNRHALFISKCITS